MLDQNIKLLSLRYLPLPHVAMMGRVDHTTLPLLLLLTLAPALSGLVGPPGAALLVVLRHLHAVLSTPAFRLLGVLRG